MPYDIIVCREGDPAEPAFEKTLGSATVLIIYWQQIGRILSLPMMSSLIERADAWRGFIIEGSEIEEFKMELGELEKFWRMHSGEYGDFRVPEDFFQNLDEISRAMDLALKRNLQVMIA